MAMLIEQYKKGLLIGIVESRAKRALGFSSLRGVSISYNYYLKIKRGTQWILTHAGANYRLSDAELVQILVDELGCKEVSDGASNTVHSPPL